MGTMHFRVQRGPRQRNRPVRGPHRWRNCAPVRPALFRVGPCFRGGGRRIDVRSFPPFFLMRGLTETTPLFVQLCGDGGDTEKCNFSSVSCGSKTTHVPTSALGRARRRINQLVGFPLLVSDIPRINIIHKVDAEYNDNFVLILKLEA